MPANPRVEMDSAKSAAEWIVKHNLYLDERIRLLHEKVLEIHRAHYHAVDDLLLKQSADYDVLSKELADLRAEFAELRLPLAKLPQSEAVEDSEQ